MKRKNNFCSKLSETPQLGLYQSILKLQIEKRLKHMQSKAIKWPSKKISSANYTRLSIGSKTSAWLSIGYTEEKDICRKLVFVGTAGNDKTIQNNNNNLKEICTDETSEELSLICTQ